MILISSLFLCFSLPSYTNDFHPNKMKGEKVRGGRKKMKEGRARGMEARIRFIDFLLKDSESIDLNQIVL